MLNFGFPKDHLFGSQKWRHEHIVDRLGRLNIVLIDDHNDDGDDDGANVHDDDFDGHNDFSNNYNDNATLSSCWRVRGRERR